MKSVWEDEVTVFYLSPSIATREIRQTKYPKKQALIYSGLCFAYRDPATKVKCLSPCQGCSQ